MISGEVREKGGIIRQEGVIVDVIVIALAREETFRRGTGQTSVATVAYATAADVIVVAIGGNTLAQVIHTPFQHGYAFVLALASLDDCTMRLGGTKWKDFLRSSLDQRG